MSIGSRRARKRNNTRLLLALSVTVLFFILVFSNACTSIVIPPANVKNPVRVYLLKEKRHKGLVLPGETGGFVEFGYGDWDWFALMYNRWYHVFDTVLWPTQGCLGRRRPATIEGEPFRRDVTLMPVLVEAGKAKALLNDLNSKIDARKATAVFNRKYEFEFVRSDDDFWLFHNCNDSIADWMEALGCDVSWRPIRLGIALEYGEAASEDESERTGRKDP